MEAYHVESSVTHGRTALQDLFEFVVTNAGKLEAHEVEEGIFRRLMPIGLAAMQAYFGEKGTGDMGPAIERDDGKVLDRESSLCPRNYFSIFGKFPVPRTCYRTPGEPGVFPLDCDANLPERCYSYYLQEWMNVFNVEHPFAQGSNQLKRFFSHDLSQTAMQNVASNAHRDYDEFYEQKAPPPPESEGELLVVSFDGKGVPMIEKEAAKLKAKLDKDDKLIKKKEALVGVSYTVDRKVRIPDEVAEQLIDPAAAKKRRLKEGKRDKLPKAQNTRRMASLKRKAQVMEAIRQDAKRRDPQHERQLVVLLDGALSLWNAAKLKFSAWVAAIYILDIMHVLGYLRRAGNALYGEQSPEAKQWVRERLLKILQGRVGYVIGGMKQTLAKRHLSDSQQKTIKAAITYFQNHRQWMKYDQYLTMGLPIATGVAESACNSVVRRRMEGEGKRWSIEGAESILMLRSLSKSGDLDEYAKFHACQEHARLYEYDRLCTPISVTKMAA